MGDIADMMIDGTLDCETGELIDGASPGYPRTKRRRRRRKKPKGGVGNEQCPKCGKRFETLKGVKDHYLDFHSGRLRIDGTLFPLTEHERALRMEADHQWALSQSTISEEQDFGA